MQVQFVEIYNEVVRDLLNEDPDSKASLRILRDAYGMTDIEGVVKMDILPENKIEVDNVMTIAARNRSVRCCCSHPHSPLSPKRNSLDASSKLFFFFLPHLTPPCIKFLLPPPPPLSFYFFSFRLLR
jgi:hypothetical protein